MGRLFSVSTLYISWDKISLIVAVEIRFFLSFPLWDFRYTVYNLFLCVDCNYLRVWKCHVREKRRFPWQQQPYSLLGVPFLNLEKLTGTLSAQRVIIVNSAGYTLLGNLFNSCHLFSQETY